MTEKLDIDEIRLTPDAAKLPRGETISLAAVGYKKGKSVGDITGRGGVAWQSSKPEIVQANGPTLTAAALGQSSITAKFGSIVSQPAKIDVVDTPAESLAVKPETIRLRVGESVRLGADVSIMRGKADVSSEAEVTPASEDVVRYAPETRSLVGVSPGQSSVSVGVGKEMIDLPVEVLPALSRGKSPVERSSSNRPRPSSSPVNRRRFASIWSRPTASGSIARNRPSSKAPIPARRQRWVIRFERRAGRDRNLGETSRCRETRHGRGHHRRRQARLAPRRTLAAGYVGRRQSPVEGLRRHGRRHAQSYSRKRI